MTHRTRLAIAAVVLVVFCAVLLGVCVHRDTAPEGAPVPPVLKLDDGGLLLTFHVATCEYGLFDAADKRMLTNLRDARPADFERLKQMLRERVKKQYPDVDAPEDLRNRPDVVDRLRGHPYF